MYAGTQLIPQCISSHNCPTKFEILALGDVGVQNAPQVIDLYSLLKNQWHQLAS